MMSAAMRKCLTAAPLHATTAPGDHTKCESIPPLTKTSETLSGEDMLYSYSAQQVGQGRKHLSSAVATAQTCSQSILKLTFVLT